MKSRESLLRSRQFDVEEKSKKLADLEAMIGEFKRMALDLEQQIEAEHVRTGIRDINHFAYPPFAKAARQRRDNLLASVDDLAEKLAGARLEVERAREELRRVELMDEINEERGRRPRPAARMFRPSSKSA
jgi:hypothetical protein